MHTTHKELLMQLERDLSYAVADMSHCPCCQVAWKEDTVHGGSTLVHDPYCRLMELRRMVGVA